MELHYSPGFSILLFSPTLPQQYCRQYLDTLVGSISSVFKKLFIRPIDTAPCFSNSDGDHDDSCIGDVDLDDADDTIGEEEEGTLQGVEQGERDKGCPAFHSML